MNLVFDFGNTRTKGAVFKEDQLVQSFYIENSDFEKIREIVKWDEIQKIGITSVINFPGSFTNLIKQFNKPIVSVDSKTPLPIRLDYDTPATLGADRICNAVAGFMLHPNKNVLIIDLGTCNKYDFIDDSGNYKGGSIAPGYKMRLDAMHHFTANLPLLEPNQISSFIGKSTKTAMETGAFWGVVGEINHFVTQYQSQFNDTIVVVTGGYLKIFEKVLKNFIFADPNLTLKGLNSILNYQEN